MPEPMTITEAAEFIRKGELTPSALLDQCLARIDRYEERVKAWVYLDRDGAREQAARLTAELKQNDYRGPLHGIPIGIKDIIDVFDMPTACGSKRWANSFARRDATCVERLRQAGAIIVGKTVTTAYASFDPPPTRNPWNLDRTPGGSSSGSAAAVACGMCLGALATQTGGSITRPASYCGVYSLKPTHGRVSVDGVLPLAPSLDHIGVMANCVRDLAIVFQTIAGSDNRDPHCRNAIVHDAFGNNYEMPRDPDMGYEHQWMCVTDDFFPNRCDDAMRAAFDATVRKLVRYEPVNEQVGRVRPVALPAGFAEAPAQQLTVMATEAAAYHEPRYRRHPDDYPPKITSLIEHGLRTSAAEYARCKQAQARLVDDFRTRFRALLVPATPAAAPNKDTTGDPAFNAPWSFVGMPVVSLPFAWTADGMPLAVQLVAKRNQEADLFQTAAWVEAAIGFARRPLPL
ncbi:Glutamyl-tRNA(Gln) amidotransferase subunit A [Gemmata sp. SH-PL17]|uniref:amidase n=1 Tax=Gemmata sp. SH-PL17 TaxID=1630693 RepID=UPI00078E426F|nr:amidase [Gemmata sp. SH-PL17]AMV28238.1 Glutamyl-tRNA(Gln) amidotransferase subunit A [Gemmata sp. SH-PL17]